MPLATTEKMLRKAQAGNYAVGAFNAENMEMVQAIISAAEQLHAPVILQTTPGTIRYASMVLYRSIIQAEADKATVPVAIHLDHGNSFGLAMQALRAGYTSIMIDGSKEVFEKNIALTKLVTDACRPCGIPVEGELGRVGGKEDDLESEDTGYTDPKEAVRFVRETGVSSLAIGVGTSHGVYAKIPMLNTELIRTIRSRVDVPLVLHGASGLTDEAVKECVLQGICKVNFATELRVAYTKAIKKQLLEKPGTIDPKKYGAMARQLVKECVINRILVLGSNGKAD